MMTEPAHPAGHAIVAAVLGPPSPATATVLDVVMAICGVALGECRALALNSLQDWEDAQAATESSVALCQYPSPDLVEALSAHAIPVLIVIDDPVHVVAELVRELGSQIHAERLGSASFACLSRTLEAGPERIAAANEANLSALCERLAQLASLPAGDVRLGQMRAQTTALGAGLSALCHRVADVGAEATLVPEMGGDGEIGQSSPDVLGSVVQWSGTSFLLGDLPDTPVVGAIDLVGPARCLVYGPYLHLPAGFWTAIIALDFVADYDSQRFAAEVVCDTVIARGRFALAESGSFEIEIAFAHRTPQIPLELRLFSEEGALGGRLSHFSVRLGRRAQIDAGVPV